MRSVVPAAPTLQDIHDARVRITRDVWFTPIVRSDVLDERVGGRVFVKAECLQVTGAFKARGAFNRLRQFTPEQARAGVITYSSGNHGQAIALAAKRIGAPATVLMPHDSVAAKVALTRSHGAEVRFFQRGVDDSLALGEALAAERGAVIVPPANDPDIIAGQGTAALEMIEQLRALAAKPEVVITPCGSGGLTAGCAIAVRDLCPDAEFHAIEPEAFDDTRRSLAAGERLANAPGASTLCDALTARIPAPLTFAINKALGVSVQTVSDEQVVDAMAFAFRHLKLVMEPAGASSLAALLAGKIEARGGTVAIVCSGGNVEAPVFARAIAGLG